MKGTSETKDSWDKAWIIAKIVSAIVPAISVPLLGYYFTCQYNEKQFSETRPGIISDIILQLTSDNINSKKKEKIAIMLAAYDKHAISPLISLLKDDDKVVRMASASALKMVGNKSVEPLCTFILNEFIPARYKGEAITILDKISPDASAITRNKVVAKMSKKYISVGTEIDYGKHPFIAPATVLALYRLGTDLGDAYLPNIDLSFNDLKFIKLKNAVLKWANLSSSTLENAVFEGCDMEGADLDGTIITNANFKNTKLKDGILSGVTGFETANFSGVTGLKNLINKRREQR